MAELNMKNIREQFKKEGIFYTDSELAKKLKALVDEKKTDYKTVYDPTAGQGNLLAQFKGDYDLYGQDIHGDELEKAREILGDRFHYYTGDTLADDGFKGMQFDVIVGNPPFSIKWNPKELEEDERFKEAPALPPPSKADYAFLLHIIHHLKDDGVAAVLNFPGILYRGQKEGKVRKWLIENNWIDTVISVPGGYFVDTAIATCILVLRKNKDTTDIKFESWLKDKSEVVPLEKVKNEDYTLAVGTYVDESDPVEPIDIGEVNAQVMEFGRIGILQDYANWKAIDMIDGGKHAKEYIKMLEDTLSQIREMEERNGNL
jgi:type I restriction-modification system DNA methylase subunit